MLATDAFDRYQTVTGGVLDETINLLKITSSQYVNLKSLDINVNGVCVFYHGSVTGSIL
jgi:hypothetical protein